MTYRWISLLSAGILVASTLAHADAQAEQGPYARIAILRPHDGDTVDFEAGYLRHLEWHRQAKDPWAWFGWTIWAGERQRWFVYATFGHSAASLDNPVSPAEDERDNVSNVTPHAQYLGNAVYEYLPEASNGTGTPQATPRVELTTVDVAPGAEKQFEGALTAEHARLKGETLWYRMIAGGPVPRYVRLRPRANLAALLTASGEASLPERVGKLTTKVTIEVLNLRPTMSYGITPRAP
jgi:hypothetical protein